ncbi:MAG TPA: hypothetical protein VFD92_08650 [Candidatus Binatia bacterium]|nr:hypothetical protein [Candidatus Binatia bacterium]
MIEQANNWRGLLGGGGSGRRGRRAAGGRPAGSQRGPGRRAGGRRVNWDEVLSSVPQRFGVEDIMKHPGAASKGRAQVYPALTRWETAGRIRRISKGVYEKGGSGGGGRGARGARSTGKRAGRRGRRPAPKKGGRRPGRKPKGAAAQAESGS